MANKNQTKWNWKIFWIVLLVILLVITSYSYVRLKSEYNTSQQEAQKTFSELQLNLTKETGKAEDKLEDFLRTHDCYERGYFANKFCYDQQCATPTCQEGYKLVCIQN